MNIGEIGRTFFQYLYDGILIVDRDSVVQYINPAYTRITGITEDKIIGKPLKEVRPGARLVEVVSSGEPIVGALRREKGVDYTVNMSPILEDGKVTGAISVVSNIEDVRKLSKTINKYESEILRLENRMQAINRAKYTLDDIIAKDPVSVKLKDDVLRIARKETTVVLMGESGTGKELYAQAIHNASSRKNNSFIAVNCASFQKELLESELFGYEDGAFTGAKKGGKMGLFEAADNGTIFLDEISEMSMETQGHLLRTLQEHTIRRVGSIKEIPVNIRIVAATNKNLEKCVEEGTFRHDLYYRIAIYPVRIPPLSERQQDIPALSEAFCDEQRNALKRNITISEETKAALMAYRWPGNVRELRNA
ncbi:MAG: sigma-54 interaction domain-containing protein, partial [Oscillospiraceae bacterium]